MPVKHILISHVGREEAFEWIYENAGSEGACRDVIHAIHRLQESRKGNGAFGSPTRAPNAQTRQCGGDETSAQDEMGKSINILEHAPERIDVPMRHLANVKEDASLEPRFFPPSRTCTNISAETTTTLVVTSRGGTASLKTIKASSRKPTSQSIVSQWLKSEYGSKSSRKRKRTPAHMGTEPPDDQSGLGSSLMGSIKLLLSPEQEEATEVASGVYEVLPVIRMDVNHSDQQAARALKRRRVQTPLQPLVSTCYSPLP